MSQQPPTVPPSAPPADAGARREATVLFADISGFTSMSEKMDPEEVTAVMNRCFELLETIVREHGGHVDKYIGDCVMAVFGVPHALDDAPAFAVHAAVAMRDGILAFNRRERLPVALEVHAGVASGPVLAGDLGGSTTEFTVVGDTVSLADQLKDLAPRGAIWVAPATRDASAHAFGYAPATPLRFRERDVATFAVTETRAPVRLPLPTDAGAPDTATPARDEGTRESERRYATVVFADVTGFTAMLERLDADAARTARARCLAILEDTVTAHGGHLDKYIGDCIMALFGVPNAFEGAPRLAVRAALEMRERIAAFNRDHDLPVPLTMHAGVNSGLVLAGDVGGAATRDFTVMGDTVNLASRLKDSAPAGAIWIGPTTYRYTRRAFDYAALPPLTLKGKAEPVPAWEVRATREHKADGPGVAEGTLFSGLVGREHELAALEEALAGLAADRGGIVSLVGEAGLGKSRLVSELIGRAEARGFTVLRGAAVSIGRTLPYHPFVDLFRRWAGIGEDDTEATEVAKLEAAVAGVLADGAADVVPFVGTLMGLRLEDAHAERLTGIDPEAMEKLLVKGVRDLLHAIARTRPTVVVFEDVHWADASSVKLLEGVLRLVRECPILFLHVFRPAYAEPARRLNELVRETWADRHVELVLERLTTKQCDTLARNLLGLDELPYAKLGALLRKADGNPFFIEEIVRSLIEEGAVERHQGRFRVTARIETVVIPGTIQEIIMGRVDRLLESVRRVLQTAAVIGRTFQHHILAAVVAAPETVDTALDDARQREIIEQRRAVADVEYLFKHALAQETIYESILRKTRKEMHEKVAESIESLCADRLPEFYGMLAYHYTHAGNVERAEDYLFKAGDEATRAAASSEALEYFQEASRLYFMLHGDGGDPVKKAALEKNIGLAMLNKGGLVESIAHFNQALEHLGEHVPTTTPGVLWRFATDFAVVLMRLYLTPNRGWPAGGEHDHEVLLIRYSRAKAQTITDTTRFFFDTIGSLRRLGATDAPRIDEACGMYAGGAALFSFSGLSLGIAARFLGVAGRLVRDGNVRDLVAYRCMRFVHHYLAGDWRDEWVVDEALLEEGLRYGQLWDVITYLDLACERDLRRGEFAAASAKIARLGEIADTYSSDFAISGWYGYQALLLLEQRKVAEAKDAVEAYYRARVEKLFNLLARGWAAKVRVLEGDREGAAAALGEAEEIVRTLGQVPAYHYSPYALSRFLFDVTALEEALANGDRRAAGSLRRRARRSRRRALRSATCVASERTETYRLCGRLAHLLGHGRRAARWWQRSAVEGERLGARPELARTYVELGRRLGGANGRDADALVRGRKLLVELDLAWDLAALAREERAA